MKNFLLLFILFFILGCTAKQEATPEQTAAETTATAPASDVIEVAPDQTLKDGDIIFHTSTSGQSMAIQIASNSKYSHVGLIFEDANGYQVFEAVQPVKKTPLQTFINRGENKHYVVKRLKNRDEILTPDGIQKMKELGKKYINKDYDSQFMWSDDRIYCSELVWKIYQEAFGIKLGELEKIKDFDLSDPVVAAKAKERYGNNIPLEEPIITPDRVYQSDQLVTILEK